MSRFGVSKFELAHFPIEEFQRAGDNVTIFSDNQFVMIEIVMLAKFLFTLDARLTFNLKLKKQTRNFV